MNDTGIPNKDYLVIIEKPLPDTEGELTLSSPYGHKPLSEGDMFHFTDWCEFSYFIKKNISNPNIKISAYQGDWATSTKYLRLDPAYIASKLTREFPKTEMNKPVYNVSENIVKFAKEVIEATLLARSINPPGDIALEIDSTIEVWEAIVEKLEKHNFPPVEILWNAHSVLEIWTRDLWKDQSNLKADLSLMNTWATAIDYLKDFIHYGRLQNSLTSVSL